MNFLGSRLQRSGWSLHRGWTDGGRGSLDDRPCLSCVVTMEDCSCCGSAHVLELVLELVHVHIHWHTLGTWRPLRRLPEQEKVPLPLHKISMKERRDEQPGRLHPIVVAWDEDWVCGRPIQHPETSETR